ncbi:MAG: SDR family NAD(P)-dependent oxidoreductase, partial [Candidatus Pacebacteria bacterium]|nr:SDR family NAD(P)-dependent oxidoreductase [Candidatus Paceibacterota bacterium]
MKRRWLVTGASRGIGLAVVQRAIAAGDQVALVARGAEIDEIAAEFGGNAIALRADVARDEDV